MKESEPGAEPEIVYHYTSHQAALSIVQTGELWLTNLHYLNDSKEFWWFYDRVQEYVSEREKAGDPVAPAVVARIENTLRRRDRLISICVGCFSARDDDASQWHRYADDGRGVALGIRVSGLREAVRPRDGDARGVSYGPAACRAGVDEFIRDVEATVRTVGLKLDVTVDRLSRLATFSKDPSFDAEREYRVALFGCGYGEYKFRHKPDTLTPYVVLPIGRASIVDIKLGSKSAKESEAAWDLVLNQLNGGKLPEGVTISRSESGNR